MKSRDSTWFSVVAGVLAWSVAVVATGLALKVNWKLFLFGWELWT